MVKPNNTAAATPTVAIRPAGAFSRFFHLGG